MHPFFRLFIFLLLCTSQLCAQDSLRIHIFPREKTYSDTSITLFLHDLQTAAMEKDTGKLGKLIDHENIFAFTIRGLDGIAGLGKNGWESFKVVFGLRKNPKKAYIWKALLDFTRFGCLTDSAGTTLYIPGYLPHSHLLYPLEGQTIYLPFSSKEYSHYDFCMGNHIPVYEKADSSSVVIDTLSYELVYAHYSNEANKNQWDVCCGKSFEYTMMEVTTKDKKTHGWVDGHFIYPFHFRLSAKKSGNKWLIDYYFPPN